MRKNNLPLDVSGEDKGSLSYRRNLGFVLSQHKSKTPDGASKKSPKSKGSKIKFKYSDSENHKKQVVTAIVITAVMTFVVATLLFLCCCRCCGSGRVRQNDERPLLSMSISDSSVGTYHISMHSDYKKVVCTKNCCTNETSLFPFSHSHTLGFGFLAVTYTMI